MCEGELDIFFKSANPGLKSMDEEKKVPSNKPLKTLAVGSRASARGSAAFNSERSGKMAILFLFVVQDALLDDFRAANVGCHLAVTHTASNEKRDCSNWGQHLLGALTGIVGDYHQYRRRQQKIITERTENFHN